MDTKSKTKLKNIKTHISVLESRISRLKPLIQKRFMKDRYNLTEQKRILLKIKKAKTTIAEIEFI